MSRKLINIRNTFLKSLLTSALSILPMVVLVFVLSLSKLTPINTTESITLGIGCVIMILGLTLFQIGASNGISRVGEYMGTSLSKQAKLSIVIIFALALGALITCAEPSILIISTQININRYLLIGMIAAGVGIFVVIGILRIVFAKSLKLWYLLFYFITFVIICILQVDPNNAKFLPFIFDSGGITTGSATVPFILALGAGFAAVKSGKKANDDSFGLVGMASIGPIICMAILILANNNGFAPYERAWTDESVLQRFIGSLIFTSGTQMGTLIEVALALAPILIIFFIYELIYIKLPRKEIGKLMIGFAFSYVGLTLFLTATTASMSPVGLSVGSQLACQKNVIIFVIAFIIGLVTILCEPAVHSLTTQIEQVSDGSIKKLTVLITLSLGVGVAILLAAIRNIYGFSIMYYLVPGYTISLILMFFCPNLFTAIAFDSGGTASGPMSVSFVVPMMVGITSYNHGVTPAQLQDTSYLEKIGHAATDFFQDWTLNGRHLLKHGTEFYAESFGTVALIALTPIIAIQILGMISQYKSKSGLRKIRTLQSNPSNAKIINLM